MIIVIYYSTLQFIYSRSHRFILQSLVNEKQKYVFSLFFSLQWEDLFSVITQFFYSCICYCQNMKSIISRIGRQVCELANYMFNWLAISGELARDNRPNREMGIDNQPVPEMGIGTYENLFICRWEHTFLKKSFNLFLFSFHGLKEIS